jgi:hypothetical protein
VPRDGDEVSSHIGRPPPPEIYPILTSTGGDHRPIVRLQRLGQLENCSDRMENWSCILGSRAWLVTWVAVTWPLPQPNESVTVPWVLELHCTMSLGGDMRWGQGSRSFRLLAVALGRLGSPFLRISSSLQITRGLSAGAGPRLWISDLSPVRSAPANIQWRCKITAPSVFTAWCTAYYLYLYFFILSCTVHLYIPTFPFRRVSNKNLLGIS